MKLINIPELEVLILEVTTTGREKKELYLPKTNIHYWYPFNINFSYKYTDSKGYMYLVKEKNYEGKNIYGVDILKRTKVLPMKDDTPFNEAVYKRNCYIMYKAETLGMKTLFDTDLTIEDVEKGFKIASNVLKLVKEQIALRHMESNGETFFSQLIATEEQDQEIYAHATEKEESIILEIGEIFTMLSVMRKLVEER